MRIITCAGYYRTGSSAVTDFFSEFSGCKSLGSYEFRFVQDPDGISDLEYNLCENPHRHNSSYAIKRFIKYSDFLNGRFYAKRYKEFFGDAYWKLTMQYVDELTQLKCKTWWHRDQIDRGELFYFIDKVYEKLTHLLRIRASDTSLLKNEIGYYTAIDKSAFYEITKRYIRNLINSSNIKNADYIMIDQLVPPTNIDRYLNYFDDIKVISVERDPRDLYILEKTKYKCGIIPYKNVEDYCKWYRITRSHHKSDESDSVLYLNFEDMVYNYEATSKKLMEFVGLKSSQHDLTIRKFIPEVSQKNTNLKPLYPSLASDIEYIERMLPEFLYDFRSGDGV